MEGFFPLRILHDSYREEEPCLDLFSAHCPNWPVMESFLARQRFERDERKEWWERPAEPVYGQGYSVRQIFLDFATVTLVAFTESNEPCLVASVNHFDLVDIAEEDSEEDP